MFPSRSIAVGVLAGVVGLTAMVCAPRAQPPADEFGDLARSVSAVLDLDGSPRLLLIEAENGVSYSRVLSLGDEYRDGWRIGAVNPLSVVLIRDGESLRVALPRVLEETKIVASAERLAEVPRISLTNSPFTSDFEGYESAIERGDFRARLEVNLKKNAMVDELRILAREGGPNAPFIERFLNNNTAQSTIQPGLYQGREALFRVRSDGVQTMVITTDLQTMREFETPPPQRGAALVISR